MSFTPRFTRLRGPLVAALLCLTQTACASGLTLDWVQQRYGPTEAHWLTPVEHIDHVVSLGHVQDPETTGGRLVPLGQLAQLSFSDVDLDRIDTYVRPLGTSGAVARYSTSGREGVYSVTRIHSAECPPGRTEFYKMFPECFIRLYLGPLKISPDEYYFVEYASSAASEFHNFLAVKEIRRGNIVLAREVLCFGYRNGPFPPKCPKGRSIYDLINEAHLYGG